MSISETLRSLTFLICVDFVTVYCSNVYIRLPVMPGMRSQTSRGNVALWLAQICRDGLETKAYGRKNSHTAVKGT